MIKVAFNNPIFNYQSYGGISRYFSVLAKKLKTESIDTHIYAGLHINHYLKDLPKADCSGFKLKKYPRKTGRIFQYFNALWVKYKIKNALPDILHETYYSPSSIAPNGVKTVLTVYDMIHEKFPNHFSLKDKTAYNKSLAVQRADHIICISQQTKRDLMTLLNVAEEKITVVYLGYELTADTSGTVVAPHQKPYILYVGDRGGYKNFSLFLQAYASSQFLTQHYDVICFGGGAFSDDEMIMMKRLGLSQSQIHQMSGNDLLLTDYYKSASVFVYPSLYEGFGIPPLEAMNLNCPVVCSDSSSLPEVVGDAAYLFDPNDEISIRNAIETVLNNSTLKNELIERGRARVKFFSWEKCASETAAVYRMMLG